MNKSFIIIIITLMLGMILHAQEPVIDTTQIPSTELKEEDDIDYDLLLSDLESFLDSLDAPRSYFMGSLSMGKGFYNFKSKSSVFIETAQRFTYIPAAGYFHKSGLSFAATGNIVTEYEKMNLYQLAVTPGFDHLSNRDIATGITFTKFFTKDSLSFYTTPLQNELYAYFTYRKWPVRPTFAVSYGWGSRTDYEDREELIQDLRLRRSGFTRINSTESVTDFSLMASMRRDFYWLQVFGFKDHIRVTPQLAFVSGTQKFGFNQSSNTYATVIRTGANVLYNSENVYLDDKLDFQPLSLTFFLRGEYSIGKVFIQPQVIFDYYFPSDDKNFSTLFSFNLGCMF